MMQHDSGLHTLAPPRILYTSISTNQNTSTTPVEQALLIASHTTYTRAFVPAAMERSGNWRDLVIGPALQCLEAASLGMPFEVWKTRMGRFRNEGTIESLVNVYKAGGGGLKGIGAFWAGVDAKVCWDGGWWMLCRLWCVYSDHSHASL